MKLISAIFFVAACNLVLIVFERAGEPSGTAVKKSRDATVKHVLPNGGDAVVMPGFNYLLPR